MESEGDAGGVEVPPAQYRKLLLNRLTATPQIATHLLTELARDDEQYKHVFHKIMVHNWSEDAATLFAALSKRTSASFVPVRFSSDGDLSHFYTESLSFVHKVVSIDFIFPHKGAMYNVDILFADRSSIEMFGSRCTTEQIVSGVVSRRLSNTLELDLSRLCDDPELREKQIHLYSLALLALYKRLMLRMGRDTRILNLSDNNLTQVPQEIMNFFMRGDIIGVNLSCNNLESLDKLPRMSSLLERLWLEENPLCEAEDAVSYVKKVSVLFPRLQELDGVSVNRHGLVCPLLRNFLVAPDARLLVDKFLTLYFSHYDCSPRSDMSGFYHPNAVFTVSLAFSDGELSGCEHWRELNRNLTQISAETARRKLRVGAPMCAVLRQLPDTLHDPTTFTVDVLQYSKSELTVCVEGVVRESTGAAREGAGADSRVLCFRRTFHLRGDKGHFLIHNDMLSLALPSPAVSQNAFLNPIRKLNELCVREPNAEQRRALLAVFAHLTSLKRDEAERRLRVQGWDVRKALLVFADELRTGRVSPSLLANPELSDLSEDDVD